MRKIERFTGKGIEQITGKWADTECCYRIAGKNNTNSRISRLEELGQIERQNRD